MVVTHPRTAGRHRPPLTSVHHDVSEQTALGEVMVRSLERAQLRLGALVAAFTSAALFGVPLLFLAFPWLGDVSIGEVPLGWLVLAVVIFPVVIVCAWLYIRGAERNERRFADLVERS